LVNRGENKLWTVTENASCFLDLYYYIVESRYFSFMKNLGFVVFYGLIIFVAVGVYFYKQGSFNVAFNFFTDGPVASSKKVAGLEFKDKQYGIDFKEYNNEITEIAEFTTNEDWTGDKIYTNENSLSGIKKITLKSNNNLSSIITLKERLDLSQSKMVKFRLFSDSKENNSNIQTLKLKFSSGNKSMSYIVSGLQTDLHVLSLDIDQFASDTVRGSSSAAYPKADDSSLWRNIDAVTIELLARPNAEAQLYFDRLWVVNADTWADSFLTNSPSLFSLRENKNLTYVEILPNFFGLLKKVTFVYDFIYTVKLTPLSEGAFGINGRTDLSSSFGYYFELQGIGTNKWRLYKINQTGSKELDSGEISNFQVNKGVPLWLRMQFVKDKITCYISLDGSNFTKLTEKKDAEIAGGGVGLRSSSQYLLERVDFRQ
jgi:hypothetical protein